MWSKLRLIIIDHSVNLAGSHRHRISQMTDGEIPCYYSRLRSRCFGPSRDATLRVLFCFTERYHVQCVAAVCRFTRQMKGPKQLAVERKKHREDKDWHSLLISGRQIGYQHNLGFTDRVFTAVLPISGERSIALLGRSPSSGVVER
jgi:hypothetical protein